MAAIDDLKNLLVEDTRQLEQLSGILLQEKEALANSDVKSLESLTTEKNALLVSIRDRARQKIQALVAMGFRPDSGEPSRFIRSAGLDDLYSLWQQADTRLRECQAQNQCNSRVVSHLQTRLARLTDIFRGATGHQKLYGAKGEQTTVSSGTVLASA